MAVTSGFGILEISPVVSLEAFVKNNLKVVTPGGAQYYGEDYGVDLGMSRIFKVAN
jgi:hypothetical protein